MRDLKTELWLSFIAVFLIISSNSYAENYAVPSRTDSNVIVASYNIKWLGHTAHELDKLAKVIKHFDVCGILEIKKESEVALLADALNVETGKKWGYIYGIRTHRPDSRDPSISNRYHEAYGGVWRRDRVQLGNGVVSNVWDSSEAFRNDPYVASFKRGNFDFMLVLIHTRWSDDVDGSRSLEVVNIADFIQWQRGHLQERDIILAGDFNYSGGSVLMNPLETVADLEQIDHNAKSTFKSDFTGYSSPYDHIYISRSDTPEFIEGQCALLDATVLIYGDRSVTNMEKSKSELSDHLPVWAAFDVTMADDD